MLNADEHGLLVPRDHHTGDLALLGALEKSSNFSGRRIGAHHLVVAKAGIVNCVDRRGRHVGLDPEPAARCHVNAVRRTELIAVDRGTMGRDQRVPAENENVPLEIRFGLVLVVFPSYDVPIHIVDARVDRVHGWPRRTSRCAAVGIVDRRWRSAAAVVVRERGNRRQRFRERVDPLRAVHHRGADRIGGGAGIDQNVVQGPAGQSRVVRCERQPVTRTVGVEPGDVENSVVQGVDPRRRATRHGRFET